MRAATEMLANVEIPLASQVFTIDEETDSTLKRPMRGEWVFNEDGTYNQSYIQTCEYITATKEVHLQQWY